MGLIGAIVFIGGILLCGYTWHIFDEYYDKVPRKRSFLHWFMAVVATFVTAAGSAALFAVVADELPFRTLLGLLIALCVSLGYTAMTIFKKEGA